MSHIPLVNAGKGSQLRKQANQSKYAENWEKIFGNKKSGGEDSKLKEDVINSKMEGV